MISVQRLTKPIRLYEQITSTLSIFSNKFRKWYPSIMLLEPISKLHVSKVVKCSESHHSKATELCSRKSYFRPLCRWKTYGKPGRIDTKQKSGILFDDESAGDSLTLQVSEKIVITFVTILPDVKRYLSRTLRTNTYNVSNSFDTRGTTLLL